MTHTTYDMTTKLPTVPADSDLQAILRNTVADRWRRIAVKHGLHAVDRRHHDPIGAHAITILYTEPDNTLKIAARLFIDDPENDHLPALLDRLAAIAARHGHGYDPRTRMATHGEPMTRHATWIGLAVSTLDTPDGTLADIKQAGPPPLQVPARGYARLTDGTRLQFDLTSTYTGGTRLDIACTRTLNHGGLQTRNWRHLPHLATNPETATTWQAVDRLHDTIARVHP